MPARACGTIRTPDAATMNRNTARTISAMTPASITASSFRDERRGAPDLDDLDPLAGLDHLVVVVRARGPHLAVDPHATDPLVVGDPLDDHAALADQRGRTGAQQRRPAPVRARERPHRPEQDHGDDQERRPADQRSAAEAAD